MALIHEEDCFLEATIREKAKKYGFSDPLPLELFLWDCEIIAQLQSESEDFVLKGGAAVQLHLPVDMQRGSVDVDIICPFTEQQIAKTLSRIHSKIPFMHFEKYTPKQPAKGISMVTYLAKMPPVIPSKSGSLREVKIDFLLENLKVPTQSVEDAETFAVKVKKLKCYAISSLLGDKLLTLAENTIGISEAIGIPKQIYDVSVLSEAHPPTQMQFLEIAALIEKVVPLEAKYRGIKINPSDALEDVEQTMDKYALIDTPSAHAKYKKNTLDFQQFYVNSSQKWPLYDWSACALKIRFLAKLLKAIVKGETDVEEVFDKYSMAIQTAQLLESVKGEKAKRLNRTLMETADIQIPYFKSLRGKPLNRVFWQVISPTNISTIQHLVQTQTG